MHNKIPLTPVDEHFRCIDILRGDLSGKNILCVGGLDPSGGAGVLADLRMVSHLGAHASCLISTTTTQGRTRLEASQAMSTGILERQWAAVFQDMPVHAIKLGAIASAAQARWLSQRLQDLPATIPVVLDPVLLSSSGTALSTVDIMRRLAPQVQLVTPNQHEALDLFPEAMRSDRRALPCAILVTASDAAQATGAPLIHHRLLRGGLETRFTTPLRPGRYRGSGCLLASAITCALAAGLDLQAACGFGLREVPRWLDSAWRFEDGIHLPQAPLER